MAQPVIEIEDLYFSYGSQTVLAGVNFIVEARDFVALLGPNGGGKTTLIKILAGLLKPQQGTVRLLGRPPEAQAGVIGYVPQDVLSNPAFPVTVWDVVLMGRLGAGGRRSWSSLDKSRAREALERVGMWPRRQTLISRLSGGQRQRVFIARSLVGDPKILLLDEPTSSVDQEWQTHLFELLKKLNQHLTIVLVSHDLTVISAHVKSVACLNQTLYHHPSPEITADMILQTYHCPVELIAHGLPHRVLAEHERGEEK